MATLVSKIECMKVYNPKRRIFKKNKYGGSSI